MQEKKSKSYKTFITILISLAFAAIFMWLAFRDFEFGKLKNSLSKANYLWVLVSAFFGILAYWFRAIRWNILLEPLGYSISSSNSLWTISFGYLMNLTIPRSGEVARATALYGVEKVPVDKSFGTIILERVIDLVCMLGFLGLTMIFKYDLIVSFFREADISINPYYVIAFISAGILGLFLFFKFKDHFRKYSFLNKLINFIEGILKGLTSIFKLKQNGKFILYTLAIWVSYYLAAYLICFALPETSDFTIADGFYIIVVGTLGMMVPASGGIGAFHFALKIGISALFVSMGKSASEGAEVGLSYAFLSHTLQMVIMLVMGFIAIPILAKSRAKMLAKESGGI
ncbi:MAG: lysylphosphatidylglycerol synthase transmembrane domain-containing protein [Bergeyella sp.]